MVRLWRFAKNILHSEEFDILQIISETKLGIFDLSSTIIEAAELGIDILFSSINKPHKLQGLQCLIIFLIQEN